MDHATQNICLSSMGKGRLQVGNKKYVFSYESGLDKEHAQWILALNFPLRPTETFKLDWSEGKQVKLDTSIDEKILKENKNVNPQTLDKFTHGLADLIQEVIELRAGESNVAKFRWKKIKNDLKTINKDKYLKGKFSRLGAEGYFTLMEISFLEPDKSYYKLDLVVRKCFEKSDSDSPETASVSVKLH